MAILRALNTRSASPARVYVAPSGVTASGSSPARSIGGVMQVKLRPLASTRAWTAPYLPNRTRTSPRSSMPLPCSVSKVPPETGAP